MALNEKTVEKLVELGLPENAVVLSKPQRQLVFSERRFPGFVAGFGSGKSSALIQRSIRQKLMYPGLNVAYYLPTYDLVSKIAYPYFEEALQQIGYRPMGRLSNGGPGTYRINKNEKEIELFEQGKFILRTMDSNIIGFQVADSCVDEIDTLKTEDARTIWQKIIARNRQVKPDGKPNTIAIGTTPEGFKFVYDNWKRAPPSEEYELIQASTYTNLHNLPDNYIQDLIDLYPSALVQAYIEGEFVNLKAGAVYHEFDRRLNGCDTQLQAGEPIHVGMDFNVSNMAAAVAVPRNLNQATGYVEAHFVAELTGLLDTPAMIKALKTRFPNRAIYVYPDATGNARDSSNASESDLSLLRANFTVFANNRNPFVKDRVLSMNAMIHSGQGRRLKVNTVACPALTEGLEKQAYDKNGEPDKMSGLDHILDAAGYFISFRFPVARNGFTKVSAGGV